MSVLKRFAKFRKLKFLEPFAKEFGKYEEWKPILAFLILFVGSAILSPHFFTLYNLMTMLTQASIVGTLAIGETLIILMGGIDLSAGAIMGFSNVIIASLLTHYLYDPVMAAFAGIILGTACGFVNGLIITKGKIPSFVTTLAMMIGVRGLILLYTGGYPVAILNLDFTRLAGYIGFIPILGIILLVTATIMYIILKVFKLGRYIYAVGGNEDAVRLSGINADDVKVIAFTLAGFCYGLAGVMMAARLSAGYPQSGEGYELDAIASAVLGAVRLSGGVGSPLGSLIGALIMTLITNILVLLAVSPFWQYVVKGVVLVLAATALSKGLRYVK